MPKKPFSVKDIVDTERTIPYLDSGDPSVTDEQLIEHLAMILGEIYIDTHWKTQEDSKDEEDSLRS